MTQYYMARKKCDGLYMVSASRIGEQLWASIVVRKGFTCASDGVEIRKGERAFRPLTNGGNRMHRISQQAMNRLVYVTKQKQ